MSQEKTLDFRTVVERANHSRRTSSVILGFLTWGAIVATTWLSLFALDNLLNLPSSLRFPFAILGLVITVGCFFKYVVGPLRERSSDELTALKLEEQFGIKDNVLINTMQFEDMGYSEEQKAFINATADAATTGWNHVPLRELLQVGRLTKWSCAVVVLLVSWIAYSIVAPDYLESAFNRYAFSFADAPPAAASKLVMTPAEDVTIAEYANLDVSLDVSKFIKGKELVIYPSIKYKEGVGVFESQSVDGAEVKMRPVVGNPNLYQYTFETVRRSFSFRIFVGSTYTHSVQVTVNPAAKIIESTFTVTPPAYVAIPARTQSGPPNPVKCLPTTQLGVRIKVDQAIESLRWEWPAGKIVFQDAGDRVWNAQLDVGDSGGNYDLIAVVKDMPDIVLSSGSVLMVTDRKPEVRYVDTEMSHVVVPGATLSLKFEGKDDYGMKDMKLTFRRAQAGSQPEVLQDWAFEAPGERDLIEKSVRLKIDASQFELGNKYFLEVHGNDFCPGTDTGVSDPLLLTVKTLDADLADGSESNLKDLYAALERAIQLQKQALDGTDGLLANSDGVWLDLNRKRRDDKAIQGDLDKYQKRISGQQMAVRKTLLDGVRTVPDKGVHMAARMKSIAEIEAVDANTRAFAAGRACLDAGALKRANGYGPGTSFKKNTTQVVRFKEMPARYFGLVVDSSHNWSGKAWLDSLALVGEKSAYLDSSSWKLVSSSVKDAPKALAAPKGKPATGGVLLPSLPATFVFDMGTEQPVSGVACFGKDRGNDAAPKGVSVYLTTAKAPTIGPMPLEQARVDGEFKHLRTVQQIIYNELLALKGAEFEALAKDAESELADLLGEEASASVDGDLEDAEKKFKNWLEENEDNEKLRNIIAGKAPEDLTEEDEKKLADLDLKKEALKRELMDMEQDHAEYGWDFADKTDIETFEETMHNIQEAKEELELGAMATKDRDKERGDMSRNMDNSKEQDGAMELETGQMFSQSGAMKEPGHMENPEDEGMPPDLGELPVQLPIQISELTKGLDELGEPIPESGSEIMDMKDPEGSPVSDNLDSASAAGQMTDETPNPTAKAKGRGNLGRAGQADGQMVADKAPAIPDNEVAMPSRVSDSQAEDGQIQDEDTASATSVGVGKGTGKTTDFEKSGKLPPDALNKLKELMGAPKEESQENNHGLLLALQRHHLPTTDLKKALNLLEQLRRNEKQGVDVRQALSEAQGHVRAAERALAGAYERRAKELADRKTGDAFESDTAGGTVPAGYENIVSSYFKAVAEESSIKR
ncbi:MAG: hypothetical protein HN969_05990 [Verrucomicrobia bacterium]|nr:hypothetical protein [Verrucomicrobiota bacterium]